MALEKSIQVVFVMGFLACQAFAVPVPNQGNFTRLGSSRNVTYFAGRDEITWEQGRQLCQSMNFTLAEVHYPEQEEFLKEALTALNEFSHYHTAGRTRVGLDSLIWDSSNSAVDPYALSGVQLDTRIELCLLFRVPDYATLWETDPCTDMWPPICQSSS